MRAEDTLQFMMDFRGDTFYNRQTCLNHLFCVIGNGYEWRNGELVEVNPDTDTLLSRWQLIHPVIHAEPTETTLFTGKIKEKWNQTNKWYPLSKEFSYLFNYPDDIQPDWMALIEECKEMLIKDGIMVL